MWRMCSCWHPRSHAWRLTLEIGRVLPLVASIHPGSCLVIHLTWDWSPGRACQTLGDPSSRAMQLLLRKYALLLDDANIDWGKVCHPSAVKREGRR